MQRAFFCLFIIVFSPIAWSQLRISEVFGNRYGPASDVGHEWVELYNESENAFNLNTLTLERLDGRSKTLGFQITLSLPEPMLIPPWSYVIIGQSPDLGTAMCLKTPIIQVADPAFTIKNTGLQTLCIAYENEKECQIINHSGAFPDGKSRARLLEGTKLTDRWVVEECELLPHTFATPGLPPLICQQEGRSPAEVLTQCRVEEPEPKKMPAMPLPQEDKTTEPQQEEKQISTPPNLLKYKVLATPKDLLQVEVEARDSKEPIFFQLFAYAADPRVLTEVSIDSPVVQNSGSFSLEIKRAPLFTQGFVLKACVAQGACRKEQLAYDPPHLEARQDELLTIHQASLLAGKDRDIVVVRYQQPSNQEGHVSLSLQDEVTGNLEPVLAGLSTLLTQEYRIALEKNAKRCTKCSLLFEVWLQDQRHAVISSHL